MTDRATLDTLRAGDRAVVDGYTTQDPPGRLLEMGLIPGTAVEVVRLAPLGDPMDLRIRGFHLSIRKQEASHVLVSSL